MSEKQRFLDSLLDIAKIVTLVGLLGTVIGMISIFNAIESGGGASSQAGTIHLSLFPTALGMVTAIPLVFAHVLFKSRVAKGKCPPPPTGE